MTTATNLFDAAILAIHAAHVHHQACHGCPQCERLGAESKAATDAYYRWAEAITTKPQPLSESRSKA